MKVFECLIAFEDLPCDILPRSPEWRRRRLVVAFSDIQRSISP